MNGLAIILIIVAGITLVPVSFAQEEMLSITTSQKTYETGDTIVISGNVNSILPETLVNLQIFRENTLIQIAQVDVGQDGSFTYAIHADGPIWEESGLHVVRASYGPGTINETEFDFISKRGDLKIDEIFEVDAGNSGTYDIQYSINDAELLSIAIDNEIVGLKVNIEPIDDGEISLDLPRVAIDAKNSEGDDEVFIILINGEQVPYEEIVDDNSRIIILSFEEEDSEIEIIGTTILPKSSSKEPSGTPSEIGILSESNFRIIPNKPNVDSMIRVAGNNFGVNHPLEFFIDDVKLESFTTDVKGSFFITSKIPIEQSDGHVDFIIKDVNDKELTLSLRIGESTNRMTSTEDVPLSLEIKDQSQTVVPESVSEPVEIIEDKPILSFVDPEKDSKYYVKRYNTEQTYRDWFDSNFPDYTLYEGIGITEVEYLEIIDILYEENRKEHDANISKNTINEIVEPEPEPEIIQEEIILNEPEPINESKEVNEEKQESDFFNGIQKLFESLFSWF